MEKLKVFKLLILQYKYDELCQIIFNLSEHISYLDSLYLIDDCKKKNILSNIFNINKNINYIYNDYLLKDVEYKFISLLDDLNEKSILENINFYLELIDDKDIPFNEEILYTKIIMQEIGYNSLITLMNNFMILKKVNSNLLKILDELNKVFIPISINQYKIEIKENIDYYFKMPVNFNKDDILHLVREFWIQIPDNKNYFFKIEGIFKIDLIRNSLKCCQNNFYYLYYKKNNILSKTKKIDTLNYEFVKKFIRYDYLGNIYTMKIDEYIQYLENNYLLYNEIIKSSFINIVKNYINNDNKIIKLYDVIFLLLLGNDDNCEMSSLLLCLIKEKKYSFIQFHDLILRRIPFYLNIKITNSNNIIKNEFDQLKLISLEDIDYKKQLLSIKNIPKNVKLVTLEKIEEMKNQNNEYYKQKTFVEYILKFPWYNNNNFFHEIKESKIKTKNYLNKIKNELNTLTYGHEEAKSILLETIANWVSNPESRGRYIGFVGPPGVGKTLLAKSISKTLNIPFSEITLGGQNDGELLHGHGYTYSGSQPGLIIKKMVDMGQDKCILYFDELDKTCTKHGTINEITSILIHLTDPNMNKNFQDRFFQGVDFPLDKVIMIFSYNDSEKIDPILLDRITEIKMNPYTINEKIHIIKNFIIPELSILTNITLHFDNDIIEFIIDNYTNEVGIREIKKKIEKIFMTINLEYLTGEIDIDTFILNFDQVKRILLKSKKDISKIHNKSEIGIINGLYATTNGDGGIIPIQIFNNFTSTNFEIKITGNQGDTMKESIQCGLTFALDYVKKHDNLYFLMINENSYKKGFHVHTPSTATPKDGPSAGCAFALAFISKILNKPINNEIAITGEIELTGKITKIGGLNFKLNGAKKAGIKMVYIPLENKEDFDEIIEKDNKLIDDNFKVVLIDYLDEIINDIFLI
jgi:endopeptidase La